MRSHTINPFLFSFAIFVFCSTAHAQLIPIFEYDFPDSWNGTGTNITDQASTNHATINVAATITSDVPSGRSGNSIDMGAFRADAYLMMNADIAAHGGLTIELWFNPDSVDVASSNDRNIFNHGRWDSLKLKDGTLRFASGNVSGSAISGATIVADEWHHVLIELDPTPYVYVSGNLTADLTLTVDGTKNEFTGWVKTTQGDVNNQPEDGISFGKHPGLNYPFIGFLHDVKFSFGLQPKSSGIIFSIK